MRQNHLDESNRVREVAEDPLANESVIDEKITPPLATDPVRRQLTVMLVLLAATLTAAWCFRPQSPAPVGDTSRASNAPAWPDEKTQRTGLVIDLNEAPLRELNLLPGVGPVLAGRILSNRQARGPFSDLNDLARVSGIGPKTIERIRPYAVAQAASGSATADSPVPDGFVTAHP
ncbi:ComEA family DNA-binding protein [Crateriforma spongiae]|uniref:ComEA family DNA-binding protein n=1 Tax=Crateriforma spongiae TaxID=2724528 RepID=UPI0039B0357C